MTTPTTAAPPTTLTAGDLTLTAWRPSDGGRAYEAVRDSLPELLAWMPWASEQYVRADSEQYVRRTAEEWATGITFGYALVATADPEGPALGSMGLHRRIGRGGLEIGYWVHSAHTGRGYATRGAALLTRAAFALPDVTHTDIHHDVANVASGRVPAKLGYTLFASVEVAPAARAETGRQHHWRMAREDYAGSPVPALLGDA